MARAAHGKGDFDANSDPTAGAGARFGHRSRGRRTDPEHGSGRGLRTDPGPKPGSGAAPRHARIRYSAARKRA